METKICKVKEHQIEETILNQGAEILKNGGLVIFPTETVYGIGANAFDKEACKKIFMAKGRPSDNPLIVHIANETMLQSCMQGEPSASAKKIMEAFWPGAITLIMPKSHNIPQEITAGLDTVALRMPSDPIALALIERSGVPVAAPSANLSGKPSTTAYEHVIKDMQGRVDMIIGGKDCVIGLESTILDMTSTVPTVLRPGGITLEQLQLILPETRLDQGLVNADQAPKAPGMKYTHYAPKATMYLVRGSQEDVVDKIIGLGEEAKKTGKKVGILATDETILQYPKSNTITMGSRAKIETIANHLFKALREFDEQEVDIIFSEMIEEHHMGLSIMNRMKKAAGGRIIE